MGICSARKAFVGAVFGLVFLGSGAIAQEDSSLWSFNEFAISSRNQIAACRSLNVNVSAMESSFDSNPPYFLIATELEGMPTTTTLDTSNLESMAWSMDHKQGSQVVLQVVDSAGNTGGSSPVYTITEGSTDCIPDDSDTSFSISSNVTHSLSTCQEWGIRLDGGTPPYNISIFAPGSPAVTNVSTLGQDDAYTYINRAAPDSSLIVTACDSTGKWANGSPYVATQGSVDMTCGGAQSSSGNSAELDGTTSSSPSPEVSPVPSGGNTKTAAIVAGVVVPVCVILILVGVGLFLRRRKRNTKSQETARSAVPYGSELDNVKGPDDDTFEGYTAHSIALNETPGPDVMVIGSSTGKHSMIRNRLESEAQSGYPLQTPISSSSSHPAGQFGAVATPSKAQQAGFEADTNGSGTHTSSEATDSAPYSPEASTSGPRVPADHTRRPPEQVFQHTDVADTEMMELPPPYVGDRPVLNLHQLPTDQESPTSASTASPNRYFEAI